MDTKLFFTKHSRQRNDLILLQMQEGHPQSTVALGREGLGEEVPAASRPCPCLGQGALCEGEQLCWSQCSAAR